MENWQDIRLFLAVARDGGLSGAAANTGVSPATLGRRMDALETALNTRLFVRTARGYDLTGHGRRLFELALEMEVAGAAIASWQTERQQVRRVRISAGYWTLRLLTDHAGLLWSPGQNWQPEFIADLKRRDIARKQVDIGVRNARPQEAWLAGSKVGQVEFAAYHLAGAAEEVKHRWIGLAEQEAASPTGRWLSTKSEFEIVATVNQAAHALSLARQGIGSVILPSFVGDAYPDLEQAGPPIPELTTDRWLVMHHEDRHRPEIRDALRALRQLLTSSPLIRP